MLKIYFMNRFQKADDERIYYIKCNKYRNLKTRVAVKMKKYVKKKMNWDINSYWFS